MKIQSLLLVLISGSNYECSTRPNNLNEVNKLIEDWIKVYNNERPHDSLNDMTPAEYRQVA